MSADSMERERGFLLAPEHAVHLRTALVMRRFTPEDGALIVALDSDPEVVRYVGQPEPSTLERYERRVWPSFSGFYEKSADEGFWATHLAATGAFIGWFLYRPTKTPPHEPELGYRLRRACWGQGYATEGSRALLERAFGELGATRVVAEALRENRASTHVMDKLGMRLEREETENGQALDWYAIDAQRWNAARRS